MIAFVRIPAQYAPVGGELSYGIETDAAAFGIRIRRAEPDDAGPDDAAEAVGRAASDEPTEGAESRLLGARRFVGVGRVACDAAPFVRAAVRFRPSVGATGFRPADDRVVAVAVEAFAIAAGTTDAAASGRTEMSDAEAASGTTAGGVRTVGGSQSVAASDERASSEAGGTVLSDGVSGRGRAALQGTTTQGGSASSETVPEGSRSGDTLRSALQSGDASAEAPVRQFLPCAGAVAAPALLTSMPRERLIAPGEGDELTLLADAPLAVTVAATRADGMCEVRTYRSATAGLQLFRFDTRDFPGAERATVDAGPCGTVAYSLLPAPEGAQRLAWRTAEGSVEHYTFPVVRRRRVRVDRERVRGPEGVRSAAVRTERSTTVESACESAAMLAALAGLLAAPQAWAAEPEGYRPVDIVTGEAVVHRHGTLSSFEATFRSTVEIAQPWN